MRYLILAALLAGCTVGPVGTNVLHVSVESNNWYAKTVRVICSDYQIGAIHGVQLNSTITKSVPLHNCQTVRLRVEAIGNDWWVSEQIMVQPGDTLKLTIGPTLQLSAFLVRDP